jgi:hypothetical protein
MQEREMEDGNTKRIQAQNQPEGLLQQFIEVFSAKGWLDQTLRIEHRNRKYRILCNERAFIAFRINDYQGFSPGAPGWVVCFVDRHQIVEGSMQSQTTTDEPLAGEWLSCLVQGNFDTI